MGTVASRHHSLLAAALVQKASGPEAIAVTSGPSAHNGTERDIMSRNDHVIPRDFDYLITRLIDGSIVYDAHNGPEGCRTVINGGGSSSSIPVARFIGRIHYRTMTTMDFWITTTDGDWDGLRWYGPYASRREAAVVLASIAVMCS